jgi:hypothetical protein
MFHLVNSPRALAENSLRLLFSLLEIPSMITSSRTEMSGESFYLVAESHLMSPRESELKSL